LFDGFHVGQKRFFLLANRLVHMIEIRGGIIAVMQKWEYKRVMFVDVRTLDYAANKSYGKTHEEADAFIAGLAARGASGHRR
jgi:hypothetical protein